MSELATDLRAKVLIAEDDAIVALDLQGMVTRLGYDVVTIADSGQAAIAAVHRFQPDIILLDMVLSGPMDGIDVAREIQKDSDAPVVFCISSPDLAVLVRAKEISYAGYLLKPINPDSLATTIDTALYKYKLEKRVQLAEDKFRVLTEKCDVLRYFIDKHAAFGWNWSETDGIRSDDTNPLDPDLSQRVLSRIGDAVGSCRAKGLDRFSLFIDDSGTGGKPFLCAAFGIWNGGGSSMSGLLIPLQASLD